MKADLLRQEFALDAVDGPGDGLRLYADDTLALIGRAAEEGVPIVALRGLADAAPAGEAADAADFAAEVAGGHGCWEDAERFVRARRRRGLVFEVALGGDPVEAV
jgi:hypothetical protein